MIFPDYFFYFTSVSESGVDLCQLAFLGAIFVLKLGCRPKPWGFGLTIKKGSRWHGIFATVWWLIWLVILHKRTFSFECRDRYSISRRNSSVRHHSSSKFGAGEFMPVQSLTQIKRDWGREVSICQLTRFATFEQPWWLDWSSQDTSDSVLFSTYCFGPSAAWRYFGDQGWQLTSLDHPRQLDHGDLLGLPQWFWRVSNAVRTTSRSQRTQRSGVVSPSISISNIFSFSPYLMTKSPTYDSCSKGALPKILQVSGPAAELLLSV